MGKKIKKVVKKLTKPVEKLAKGVVGGIVPKTDMPQAQEAPAVAQQVEAPVKEKAESEDAAQTEAGRKKARAGGKKSLSIARSSGGGINI